MRTSMQEMEGATTNWAAADAAIYLWRDKQTNKNGSPNKIMAVSVHTLKFEKRVAV